jgi:hypothetical protein
MKVLNYINTTLAGAGNGPLTSLKGRLECVVEYLLQTKETCESRISYDKIS